MKHKNWLVALVIPLIVTSCSKDVGTAPETTSEETVETFKKEASWVPERAKLLKTLNFSYKQVIPVDGKYLIDNFEIKTGKGYVFLDEKFNVTYIVNWPAGATHGSLEAQPVYFNLDTRDTIAKADIAAGKTDNWHIKFHEIYNSTISVNFDNSVLEKGLIRTLATPFNELDVIPAIPNGLQKRPDLPVSMDPNISTWGYYDMTTHILVPDKKKTNIIYLKDGRRVKFQLENLYLGNPEKVKDKYEYPSPFFNFKYFITASPGSDIIKT